MLRFLLSRLHVLSSLVTLTNNLNLYATPAAIFTDLVAIAGNLTWNIGVISLPNADVVGTIVSNLSDCY